MTDTIAPVKREQTCPCGTTVERPKRQPISRRLSARYCSDECRTRFGRYGRSYGTIVPRALGVTKS